MGGSRHTVAPCTGTFRLHATVFVLYPNLTVEKTSISWQAYTGEPFERVVAG